jgi:Na+/phosphate symporter
MRNQDPWGKFEADHEELHEEGTFGKIVIMVVLILVGAGIGAFIGALLNPGPRYNRIQRMLEDTQEKIIFRMIIGAVIGGLSAGLFAYKTLFCTKD